MKNKKLTSFIIPNWALCYFINNDYDNLTEQDLKDITIFQDETIEAYGNCNLILGDESDELGFKGSNDINTLGANCVRLYLLPSPIQYYKVVKVARVSGRRQVIKRNLTRRDAISIVNRYPDSSRSMVVFIKQNNFSKSKLNESNRKQNKIHPLFSYSIR